MLKRNDLLKFIGVRLGQLKACVSTLNAIHFFDLNVVAEDFFALLLNEVYGYSLVNLNHTDLNKEAVDLGDSSQSVAVQVTSQRRKDKVQKTLNKFVSHGLENDYDSLKILIIGDRTGDYATLDVPTGVSFSGKNDVIDINGLMRDIAGLDVPRLESIAELIRREVQDHPATAETQSPSTSQFQEFDATQKELLKQQAEQATSLSHVAETVGGLRSAVTSQTAKIIPSAMSVAHEATLDLARDLLKQNKPRQALALLEKQRSTIWSTATPEVKASFLCAMGGAKHGLGDDVGAAQLFFEARQHNPDDEKVLCNVAVGQLLTDNLGDAADTARQVLQRNPANGRAYCVLIQACREPVSKVIEEIPEILRSNCEVAMAVGFIARNQGDIATSKKWLNIALENDEDTTPDIKGMLGETIILEITNDPLSSVRIGQVNDEMRTTLDEAQTLLVEACDAMEDDSTLSTRVTWLLNAGIARRLLGRTSDASQLFDRAHRIAPKHQAVLYQCAVSAQARGDLDAAVEFAWQIETSEEIPHAKVFLANLLSQAGRNSEAIDQLLAFLESSPPEDMANTARQTLVEIYIEEGQLAEAHDLIGRVIAADPTDVSSLVVASQLYRRMDSEEEAEAALDKGLRVAVDTTPPHHLVILGNELGAVERWSEASEILARVVDKSEDSPLLRKYIHACYRSSRLDEALEICRQLRQSQGPLAFLTEMEIAIHEETGDLSAARQVCEEYLETFPDDGRTRVRLAVVYLRQHDDEALDEFLNDQPNWRPLPVECGQQIASLLVARQRYSEAVQLLYELRRLHSIGKVHLQYLHTCITQGDQKREWHEVDRAGVDTAVGVQDSQGATSWFVIEDRADGDVTRGELPTDHPLAQELIGKKPGDAVVLKKTSMATEVGKITEVKSKYVHAFHESAQMLEVRFPEQAEGFVSLHLPKGEEGVRELLQKLGDQQDEHQKAVRTANELYRNNTVPIGAVARWLGGNILEAWSHLTSDPDSKLICAAGEPIERSTAQRILKADQFQLVIDPISLLTIHAIGLADEIVKAVGPLGIVQSTVDLLTETLHKRTAINRRGFMTIHKEGEQFIRREVTQQEVEDDLLSLDSLIKWIEANCQILPWSPALATKREERKELGEMIGEESLQTILVAIEPNRFLYSDDLRLRQLAKFEFGVDGLTTQLLLMHLLASGTIDADRYNKAIVKLAIAGFIHTSVGSQVLLEAARQADWSPAAPFDSVCALMGGDYCNENSAVGVAADFLLLLWQQPFLSRSTDYLIFRLLDDLASKRNPFVVTDKLLGILSHRFALNPIGESELQKLIAAWRAIRIG